MKEEADTNAHIQVTVTHNIEHCPSHTTHTFIYAAVDLLLLTIYYYMYSVQVSVMNS